MPDDTETSDQLQLWLQDPQTVKQLQATRGMMKVVLDQLLDAARKSTDPEVRGFVKTHDALRERESIFSKGKAK